MKSQFDISQPLKTQSMNVHLEKSQAVKRLPLKRQFLKYREEKSALSQISLENSAAAKSVSSSRAFESSVSISATVCRLSGIIGGVILIDIIFHCTGLIFSGRLVFPSAEVDFAVYRTGWTELCKILRLTA